MAFTPEEIQNLSRLFLSTDDNNTQLAFEMMKDQDFVTDLITEIFVVFKLTNIKEFKATAEKILKEHGSDKLHRAMKRKLELSGTGYSAPTEKKIKQNIKKYVAGNELDGYKFATALYNKYGKGISYLLDESSSEQITQLLLKFKEGTTFTLVGKDLTKLPKELYNFTDLTNISVAGNKLGTIPGQFKVFKNLKELNFAGNNLKSIHKNIAKLQSLEKLSLAHNLFREFPAIIFELKNLKHLNIKEMTNMSGFSATKGAEIPETIKNLTQLEELYLSGDRYNNQRHPYLNYPRISHVKAPKGSTLNVSPMGIALLAYEQNKQGIEYIFKHGNTNDIQRILQDFYDAENKTFHFEKQLLSLIPKEIEALDIKTLKFIDCRFHGTGYIEDRKRCFENLQYCPNVEHLDFTNTSIHIFPEGIFKMKNLKELYLNRSSITEIPENIGQLENLEILHLVERRSSPLKQVERLATLKNLKQLKLGYTSFQEANFDVNLRDKMQGLMPNCEVLIDVT